MSTKVSVGLGGEIWLIDGVKLIRLNTLMTLDNAVNALPNGAVDPGVAGNDYYARMWGGKNSYWPCSINHKPCAFYNGWLYQSHNNVSAANSALFITRFDGSGMYFNQGTDLTNKKWRSGRGSQFISPSGGGNGNVRSMDLAIIEHQGILFFLGANFYHSTLGTGDWVKKGWHIKTHNEGAKSNADFKNRAYRAHYISVDPVTKKERKGMSPLTQFSPFAKYGEFLNVCDAISHGNDIYYANWIDTLRFPGGSGVPVLIECASGIPSAKSFAKALINNEDQILMLTGSGVLKQINANNTTTLYDLNWKRNDRRTGHCMRRIEHATADPARSPLLLNLNNTLHAFFSSASSGHRHFVNTNSLIITKSSGWIEKTNELPESIRRYDGNLYGYADKNKFYLAHTTMSELGIFGHHGAQKSAGALEVYKYNNPGWVEETQGMPGGVVRGLIPYSPFGPNTMVPSGNGLVVHGASDYVILSFYLFDHYNRKCDVSIEFSLDNGINWRECRQFKSYTPGVGLLGPGRSNLSASPNGTLNEFYWDYWNDCGGFNAKEVAKLRITPRIHPA